MIANKLAPLLCFAVWAALATPALTGNGGGGPDHKAADELRDAYQHGFREGRQVGLEVGQQIGRGQYRALDPDLYHDRYGRPLSRGDVYVELETDPVTRLVIEAETGLIKEVIELAERRSRPTAQSRHDIPPGHYPPPGECRIWFPDRPPGQQPPPGSCNVRVPPGAFLVQG